MLGCEVLFGKEFGSGVHQMHEAASAGPCPGATGDRCPLLPPIAEEDAGLEGVA